MNRLKITTWNIERLDTLLKPPTNADQERKKAARLLAIARQIRQMNPDVLCIQEGPTPERIDGFTHHVLGDRYVPVKDASHRYDITGDEYIWFLVKPALAESCHLQSPQVWDEFAGRRWDLYLWGDREPTEHDHYRHPQVMVLNWQGQRIEFIGAHLKTKVVWRDQEQMWADGGGNRVAFICDSLNARLKLASEARNIRAYIDAKFEQVENPAVVVLGDLNDGPGRAYFEDHYLFFDLVSQVQGDIYREGRYLHHALFETPQHLRWSVQFDNFVEPERPPETLLDHILLSQSLVDGSLPLVIRPRSGKVEHEIDQIINAENFKYAQTSNHRPVSVTFTVNQAG